MTEEAGWTKAQKQAAGFAWSAAARGLSQAAGLAEYREGKLKIRTEDWNELFQSAFRIVGWREDVRTVPLHWDIPARMFEPRDVDWTSKYNFVAKIGYYSQTTGEYRERYAQSGFDELPTHAEWRAETLRRIEEEELSDPIDPNRPIRWITEEVVQRKAR